MTNQGNELSGSPINKRWILMPLNCGEAPTYFLTDEELLVFSARFEREKMENNWIEIDCGAMDVIEKTIEVAKPEKPKTKIPPHILFGKCPNTRARPNSKRFTPLPDFRKPGMKFKPQSNEFLNAVLETQADAHNREMHALNGNNPLDIVVDVHAKKPQQKPKKPKSKKGPKKNPNNNNTKPKKTVERHIQSVRSAAAKAAVGHSGRIVENLTLPMEYPAVRIKVDYENVETAIASPNEQFDADFVADETVGFIFKDPIRHSLTTATLASPVQYDAVFEAVASDETGLVPDLTLEAPYPDGERALAPVYFKANASNSDNPHGDILYCGYSKLIPEYRWFPMTITGAGATESTADVNITYVPTGNSGSGILSLYRYNGTSQPDQVDQASLDLALPASYTLHGNFDSKGAGLHYYAVVVWVSSQLGAGITAKFSMNIIQSQKIFAQKTIAGWNDNKTVASTIAINGFSAMLSNAASQLSRNGKIVAVQVPASSQPSKLFLEGGTYDVIGKFASRAQLDATTGVYGFFRPSGVNSFFFSEYQPNLNETFKLESKNDFLAIVCKAVAGTDGTGQEMFWTLASACEFRTTDTWRPQRQATSNPRDLETALEAMSKIPQWHENPLHFKQIVGKIGGYINKAMTAVNKYGPIATSILGMLA